MKYYLDCEFNGFKGQLLSLALIREDGRSMYATFPVLGQCEPWVCENVMPKLYEVPADKIDLLAYRVPLARKYLERFLAADYEIEIVADDEQDIMYFCQQVKDSGGQYVPSIMPDMGFYVARVDAYPTPLLGAVQHNAWWDANALRYYMQRDHNQQELAL